MIYNTGPQPTRRRAAKRRTRRGLQNPRVRGVLAVALICIGAIALGFLMLGPIIRAGSEHPAEAPLTTSAPVPAPATGPPDTLNTSDPGVTITDVRVASPTEVTERDKALRSQPAPVATSRAGSSALSGPEAAPKSARKDQRAPRTVRDRLRREPPALQVAPRDRKPRTQMARAPRPHKPAAEELYYSGHREEDWSAGSVQSPEDIEGADRSSPRRSGVEDLEGNWSGFHTDHPATLRLHSLGRNRFRGELTVRTGGRTAQIGVRGRVTLDGRLLWRETDVRNAAGDSWDLGANEGTQVRSDRIVGRGRDSRGRQYRWYFVR